MSGEELFRFARTRAPQPDTEVRALVCPRDIAVKANATPAKTEVEVAMDIDVLLNRWLELTGTSFSVLFEQLSSGTINPLNVIAASPKDSSLNLLTDAWKAVLKGVAGSATNTQLEELRRLVALGTLLSQLPADLKTMSALEISRTLGFPLKLPAIIVAICTEKRDALASEAATRLDEKLNTAASEYSKILESLKALLDLEKLLAKSMDKLDIPAASRKIHSLLATANTPLAIGLNLASTLGSVSDFQMRPLPSDTAGIWGTGGIVDPMISLLFPRDAGGNHTAPEVKMAQNRNVEIDPGEKFRAANPDIVNALQEVGIHSDAMTSWQMIDALQHRIATMAASLPKPLNVEQQEAILEIVADTGLVRLFEKMGPTPAPQPTPKRRFGIRPLGVADLRVVRQVLLRYERGELAHIENVLEGEERERTHRRLQRLDETLFTVTEKETENSRDAQSTDRFEVSREARQSSREQSDMSAGVKVTATYGAVNVEASTDFATQHSAEQSSSSAQKESREIVNRAVERVRERAQVERTRKVLVEVEETAIHRQSAKGPGHVIGLYRWVDKIYRAQIFNFGKRAMYELLVPQPAALFKHLMARPNDTTGFVGEQPAKPELEVEQIDPYTWISFAQDYGVSLPPPPVYMFHEFATVAWPTKDNDKQVVVGNFNSSVAMEKGYSPLFCGCSMSWYGVEDRCGLMASIGTHLFTNDTNPMPSQYFNGVTSALTFNVLGYGDLHSYAVNFRVGWKRTEVALQKWQHECFNIIMDDYERRLSEYRERVQAARIGNGQFDSEFTDLQMRKIERDELKRAILEIVRTGQQAKPPIMGTVDGLPSINVSALEQATEEIRFFEHAFEWEQMTYMFHPYYWASDRKYWDAGIFRPKGDPTFTSFLNAGAASVVLPVRNEYLNAVGVYFETGRITNAPVLPADELLARMNAEVLARSESVDDGIPEGDAWTYRVPTSLVMLEDSTKPKLPDFAHTIGRPVHPFIPGANSCGGKEYNVADWPDYRAILVEMRKLGYPFQYGDPKEMLESGIGKSLVRAFQKFCNDDGISQEVNKSLLSVDGVIGPCTLRALSAAKVLRQAGEWGGPAK